MHIISAIITCSLHGRLCCIFSLLTVQHVLNVWDCSSVWNTLLSDARFEVLMAVKIEFMVFWVMVPCNMVIGYQRFGRLCYLHLQGQRWRQYSPPKCCYLTTRNSVTLFFCVETHCPSCCNSQNSEATFVSLKLFFSSCLT
jgi:hypothetical protein